MSETVKQEIGRLRKEMRQTLGQHESARFRVMWLKIQKMALLAGDDELIGDIDWFLQKFKHYVDKHAASNRQQDAARRSRKIKDVDYDRLAPKAQNDKQLAAQLGVNAVSLSRYKKRRFSG